MISLTCAKPDCGKPLLTCRACRGRPGKDCRQCDTTGMVCSAHGGYWRGPLTRSPAATAAGARPQRRGDPGR